MNDGGGARGPPGEKTKALERDLAKVQAERDLYEAKTRTAEQALAKLQERVKGLERMMREREDEVAALKREAEAAQNLIGILEKQLGKTQDGEAEEKQGNSGANGGGAASNGKKSGVKKAPKGGPDVAVAGKKGVTKREPGASAKSGGGTGGTGGAKGDGDGAAGESENEGDEGDSDAEALPEMLDKCVGNGPGPGMLDEPVRCRGGKAPGLPRDKVDLNKSGRVYSRQMRSTPNLAPTSESLAGAGGESGLPAKSSPAAAKSPPSRGSTAVSRTRGATDSPSGTSSVAGAEAELYLLKVWEQNPRGHRAPSKRELQILGAMSPPNKPSSQRDPLSAAVSDLGLRPSSGPLRA